MVDAADDSAAGVVSAEGEGKPEPEACTGAEVNPSIAVECLEASGIRVEMVGEGANDDRMPAPAFLVLELPSSAGATAAVAALPGAAAAAPSQPTAPPATSPTPTHPTPAPTVDSAGCACAIQ